MTYDQVAEKLGAQLDMDPFKLRFYSQSMSSGPKHIVKRHPNLTLQEMIGHRIDSDCLSADLYYDISQVSILEFETKMYFKVIYLDHALKEHQHDILILKTATFQDLIDVCIDQLSLAPGDYRYFDVAYGKLLSVIKPAAKISSVNADNAYYYLQAIPRAESQRGANDFLISVFHFTKDQFRTHSTPFIFVVKHVLYS